MASYHNLTVRQYNVFWMRMRSSLAVRTVTSLEWDPQMKIRPLDLSSMMPTILEFLVDHRAARRSLFRRTCAGSRWVRILVDLFGSRLHFVAWWGSNLRIRGFRVTD